MTVLIAVAVWFGGGVLFALLLGAVLSFSEQNGAAELEMITRQMIRTGSQEPNRAWQPEAKHAAGPQGAAHAPLGKLVLPVAIAERHWSASDRPC